MPYCPDMTHRDVQIQELKEQLSAERRCVEDLQRKLVQARVLSHKEGGSSTQLQKEVQTLQDMLQKARENPSSQDFAALQERLREEEKKNILNSQTIGELQRALQNEGQGKHKELEILLQDERNDFQKIQHENKKLHQELQEAQLHGQQLEKGIAYLRTKADDLKSEKEALEQELAQRHTNTIESQELQDTKEELKAVQEQFSALKEIIAKQEAENTALKKEKSKQNSLSQELEELQGAILQAMQELTTLQEEGKAILQEKEAAVEALRQEKEQAEELVEENRRLKEESEKLAQQIEDLVGQHAAFGLLRRQLEEELSKQEQENKEKESLLAKRSDEIILLKGENGRLKEGHLKAEAAVQEKEGQLRLAQQHLAKKMKETAFLQDKCKEYENATQEAKGRVEGLQAKYTEAKLYAEQYEKEKGYLQTKLETEEKKWSSRIEELMLKNQEMSVRIRELQMVEDQYRRVQAIFAPAAPTFSPPPPVPYKVEPPLPPPSVENFDIFNTPSSKPKTRQSLFDETS